MHPTIIDVTGPDDSLTTFRAYVPSEAIGEGVRFGGRVATLHSEPSEAPAPVKRGRGRPRKVALETGEKDSPEGQAKTYPAMLLADQVALAAACEQHGALESHPAEDEKPGQLAYENEVARLEPAELPWFRLDRDSYTAYVEMIVQMGRKSLSAETTDGDWLDVVRTKDQMIPDEVVLAMIARARLGGIVPANVVRKEMATAREVETARLAEEAAKVKEKRTELAKLVTWNPSSQGLFAVALNPAAHPKDPCSSWARASEAEAGDMKLPDGWTVVFFRRENHCLATYGAGIDLGSPYLRLIDDSFTTTEAERRKHAATNRRCPKELDRILRPLRDAQIDRRAMRDEEMITSSSATAEWLDFAAPHLACFVPNPAHGASANWTRSEIDERFLCDYAVRGLKIDVVAAHDALVSRLRTHARCESLAFLVDVVANPHGQRAWSDVSREIAAMLEAAFAGGPLVSVSPGEVERPNVLARAAGNIRRAFGAGK